VKNLLLPLAIASTLLIAACGKKEEQTPAPEAQTAPPAAAPAPTSTAPATAPAEQAPADQTSEKPADQPNN
jgi:hypothetical protein